MNEFYVISTKWTYPDSGAFTFWGKNNGGYYSDINEAGIYNSNHENYKESEGCFIVDKCLVDKLKSKVLYYGCKMDFLLNKPFFRKSINLPITKLRGGMVKIESKDFDVLQMCENYCIVKPEKLQKNGVVISMLK